MEPTQYQEIFAVFRACQGLEGASLQARLGELCEGDETLRSEVLELLQSSDDDAFADQRIDERTRFASLVSSSPTGPASDPKEIGPYRVIGRLGEGGMGIVYEAEQAFPRRRVALKVIRPIAGAKELLPRFEREAGALARLKHPGIAQLYDYGVWESDWEPRPYFALELVEGVDLRTHIANSGTDVAVCLDVVARVCDAIQHAHERGIVHRDLKPDNVMVDREGRPKVLDFGVARILDEQSSIAATLTEAGQVIGTLSYMAPEQLAPDPSRITGLVDVYALGAILFELLAGRPPHSLAGLTPAQGLRMVADQETTRLEAVTRDIPLDVATIVGKALERDPARRYPSPAALAADLRRFLSHQPINARPPSRVYRMQRFVRRHRGLSIGVAGIIAVLVAGVAVSTSFWLRSLRQLKEAHWQTYRASLAAAATSSEGRSPSVTRRHLEAAPEDLRGWEWRHLESRLEPTYRALGPAEASIEVIAAGEVTDRVACAYEDGDVRGVRVYSASSGELLWHRRTPDLYPVAMAFRANDTELALLALNTAKGITAEGQASEDSTKEARDVVIAVFDVELGEIREQRTFRTDHEGMILGGLSTDAKRMVYYESKFLHVFDVASGATIGEFPASDTQLTILGFGAGGRLLGYMAPYSDARVVDLDSGEVIPHGAGYPQLSPNSSWSATIRNNASVEIRDLLDPTGTPVVLRDVGAPKRAQVSPDGRRLVLVAATGSNLEVWDVASGRRSQPPQPWGGDRLAFLFDGSAVVNGGDGKTVRVHPLDANTTIFSAHTSYVYGVSFSPDGGTLATGAWDGTVRRWDRATRREVAVHNVGSRVQALDWIGEDVIVGLSNGSVVRLDSDRAPAEGRELWSFKRDERLGGVRQISVSPDGFRLAATGIHGQLVVLDAATGERMAEASIGWKGEHAVWNQEYAVAWSPTDNLLAVAAPQYKIELRDPDDLRVLRTFAGHAGDITQLTFSPDGRWLASSSDDATVQVRDVASGDFVCPPLELEAEVLTVAFSPDGERLAVGGRDQAITLFDTVRFESLVQLRGHTTYVYRLAWSPDGETLASASGDTTVRIWDTGTIDVKRTKQ